MDSIILYATTKEDAHKAISYMCEDIKSKEEANHKLYFRRIMFGGFHICKGEEIDGEKHFIGNHEFIIVPLNSSISNKRITENKNVVYFNNCMFITGDSKIKISRRGKIIDWLLDDELEIDPQKIQSI